MGSKQAKVQPTTSQFFWAYYLVQRKDLKVENYVKLIDQLSYMDSFRVKVLCFNDLQIYRRCVQQLMTNPFICSRVSAKIQVVWSKGCIRQAIVWPQIYNQILAGFPESDNDDDDLMSVKMIQVSHCDTKPSAQFDKVLKNHDCL